MDLSTAASERRTPAPRPVLWAQVDTGFHVANRDGEFVGYVDTTADGTFVAFDGTSALVGRYTTLAQAQAAVLSAASTTATATATAAAPGRTIVITAAAVGALTGVLLLAGSLEGILR